MNRTAMLVAALAAVAATAVAAPKPKPKAPPAAAPAAAAAPGQPSAADWRTPDPSDVLVIDTNKGRVLVEMVPEAAPQTVARMRELAHENFFDGQRFFRVVENFMDQTGDPQNNGQGGSTKPNVPGEFVFRRGTDLPFATAADQTVAEIGFVKTLPVMSQSMALAPLTRDQKVAAWGLFCQGVAGMARGQDPNSGNSQFFLMRAPYPSLEKNYTAWGRVIAGQDVVVAIKVGEPVADPQDRMERVRLLADLPPADRPKVRVVDTKSAWFKSAIERARAQKGADFSACDVTIPAEVK
ncbi:peptidylprolyl isomerase [Phenylobacterium hankyongense]|uniref:peptidylprolyl isomerase n=1 Tax=Phenylobacterium hankyongense TaxID=1813876 RepID=A0A328B5X3_9CAUL|nr:peptidylprolyl isomerase [Phenylobacterium hankyongense]RAK61336.1 peptidylprolyl isomerase [Phenylobacterium hankyongense]